MAVANSLFCSAFLRLQLLPDVGWEMNFWYYLLTYLVFDIVYTMILVPYETLVPEMTDDFKQKTKFSGARISMAQMSAIRLRSCRGSC